MSRYQPYHSYKKSGVEWLGEVPKDWLPKRLKYHARIKNGQDQKKVLSENGQYPVYGSGGEFGRANEYLFDKPSVLLGRKGTIGKPLFITEPFWTVDTMYYTEIAKTTFPKFLYYSCLTIKFDFYQYGSAVPSMTQENLHNIVFATPSYEEQIIIANFLDRETAKIDTLIAKQERMIELLNEKRSAIISHAVTKGLDPNAKMKDSGVEWLGDVPEHWEISKIKFHAIFEGGSTPSKDKPEYWNGDIFWVSPKDMKYRYIDSSIDTITVEGQQANNLSIIQAGSVLMVVRSGILQRTIPVGITTGCVTLNQDMKALTFKQEYMAEYFTALVEGLTQQLLLEWRKQGATVESIESEYLANSILPIPPVTERQQIIDYINTQTSKIDTLVAKSCQAIELMKERRTALISAAVTGKIDVRGMA